MPFGCPRVLVNRERVGELPPRLPGPAGPFNFDAVGSPDILCLGDCDDVCCHVADRLGWLTELDALRAGTIASPASSLPDSGGSGGDGSSCSAGVSGSRGAEGSHEAFGAPPLGFEWGGLY